MIASQPIQLITGATDKELGSQLTEEFKAATGGMRHVIRFGAMMMMLRAHIISTRGNVRTGGAGSKDSGIKSWIEEFAPDVKLSTGYRFEDVAKAVAQSYQLPARIAKQLTFEQLVTAPEKDLGEPELKAQRDVFAYVDGTSQKSWLDSIRPPKPTGGDTSGSRRKLTPEQARKEFLEAAEKNFTSTIISLDQLADEKKEIWKAPSITDAMLSDSADLMTEFAKRIRAWLKMPRAQRTKVNLEELAL